VSAPHESPYADDELAELYDLFFSDYVDDVPMYEQFARRGETPSLELGVGGGRVALHLARAGLDVVGVDLAGPMMRVLRRKIAAEPSLERHLRVVEGDMRDFDLGERFDHVYCAANTFQHLLTTDEQVAALRCVARHLAPGGVFVAELRAIGAIDWGATQGMLRLRDTRVHAPTGESVSRFEAWNAAANRLQTMATWVYDRVAADGTVRRRSFEVTLRITGRDEMTLLLQRAGLSVRNVYGGFDLSHFDDDSVSMVVVAGLAAN
jgi:SAM-dependent methyltransferase